MESVEITMLPTPDHAARWMLAHTRRFMDELGAARGIGDQQGIHDRIHRLYISLIHLYYRFLAASNTTRTRQLYDTLNLWRTTFDFRGTIEQTYIDHFPHPAKPKEFEEND
jgi:hypothetical protein